MMVNNESVAQGNLLDKVLRFYTDNKIDVLQVQLQDVEINIKKEQTSRLSTNLVHTAFEEKAQETQRGDAQRYAPFRCRSSVPVPR